jgi:hypothetical protein
MGMIQYNQPQSEAALANKEPPHPMILISNSNEKLQVINAETGFIRSTTMSPGALYGTVKK